MVRVGKKGQRKAKKPTAEESYLQEIQNELKKNKHRICETRRRQQESAAINLLMDFILHTKKFVYTGSEKLSRMTLLSCADEYIHDHVSSLNVLLGVLCSIVACSPSTQELLLELKKETAEPSVVDLMHKFEIPEQHYELMDCILQIQANDAYNAYFPSALHSL
ncbi:uncharacterized protein [Blastocystis hominis]|uniref:BHLH domain-containing protein n=1 Tax=Blastocystis hominis TaxID=12968 RepID=D8MAA4_BLAHO|nr:uncharacterized protein [Blastocystis hominis]CBK24993.2 unnamed protein product [Blastocystis hominis]|eukprot:XP_012899041.1 uncharacterized protein [Blastocystis hominis]